MGPPLPEGASIVVPPASTAPGTERAAFPGTSLARATRRHLPLLEKIMSRTRAALLSSTIALAACGSTSSSPSPSLTIESAPNVATQAGVGNEPAGTGGAIADGTYYLTAITEYGGAAGAGTVGMMLRVTGKDYELAWKKTEPGSVSASGTLETTANTLKFHPTTGFDYWKQQQYEYTATPTSLEVHVKYEATTGEVNVFTRQ
jgi:hypothetical protein